MGFLALVKVGHFTHNHAQRSNFSSKFVAKWAKTPTKWLETRKTPGSLRSWSVISPIVLLGERANQGGKNYHPNLGSGIPIGLASRRLGCGDRGTSGPWAGTKNASAESKGLIVPARRRIRRVCIRPGPKSITSWSLVFPAGAGTGSAGRVARFSQRQPESVDRHVYILWSRARLQRVDAWNSIRKPFVDSKGLPDPAVGTRPWAKLYPTARPARKLPVRSNHNI